MRQLEKVIIRRSTTKDADAVADIHVKAWQQSYRNIIDNDYLQNLSFQDRLELRKKILQNNDPNQIHLVAVYEDKIIGFCDAGPAFHSTLEAVGQIYTLYLLEGFKRGGIGNQFLKAMHDHLAQRNLLPYVAWVLKDNHGACAFYQKNGGALAGEKIEDMGDKKYTEVAYVFGQDTALRAL